MTSRDFCYWLNGYFEIQRTQTSLTDEQVACVQKHLHMVFKHEIDPSFGAEIEELKKIHGNALKHSSFVVPNDDEIPITC